MVAALLFVLICAGARVGQGLDDDDLPIKRVWRMPLFWVPATAVGILAGYIMGAPWWAWIAALLPYAWSSLPGRFNAFLFMWLTSVHRLREAVQGALGALAAVIIMGAAAWLA